jgi:DNA-binding transcriptional regulator YbjK
MRVIERAGVAAVSQRVVAQEAGVPPSAVTYYFAAVLAPHVADPVRRAAAAAAVDGLFLRCFVAAHPPSADEVRAVLASILGC